MDISRKIINTCLCVLAAFEMSHALMAPGAQECASKAGLSEQAVRNLSAVALTENPVPNLIRLEKYYRCTNYIYGLINDKGNVVTDRVAEHLESSIRKNIKISPKQIKPLAMTIARECLQVRKGNKPNLEYFVCTTHRLYDGIPAEATSKPQAAPMCMAELDLTPQKLKETMQDFNDPALADAFIHCLYQKEGGLTETGTINVDKVASSLSQLLTTTQMRYHLALEASKRILQTCQTFMKGPYRYLGFFKCMMNTIKDHSVSGSNQLRSAIP